MSIPVEGQRPVLSADHISHEEVKTPTSVIPEGLKKGMGKCMKMGANTLMGAVGAMMQLGGVGIFMVGGGLAVNAKQESFSNVVGALGMATGGCLFIAGTAMVSEAKENNRNLMR
jgi:hypothetical protein